METTVSTLHAGTRIVYPFEHAATPAASHVRNEAMTSHVLMRVLDQLDYGVMLVADTAHVRFANRVAQRECGATQALRIVDGQLQARHDRDQQGLARALAGSRSGRRSLLTFGAEASKDPMLSLAIVPVADSDATALVVFGRRHVCEPLSVEFFAREHRLTSAETCVLRGLAGGLRPAQIARAAGVAMSTVRTQITSIRLKTGARSIGELVRLVTVLPPIVPLLAN